MKHRAVFVGFLILTFGIAAFIRWEKVYPPIESFDEVNIEQLPTQSYCEIKNNPDKYNGKVVKIDASLFWFQHGYFLEDENCRDSVDKTYLDSSRTAVSLNSQKSDELRKVLDTFTTPNVHRTPVRIVSVGRFTFARPNGSTDDISDRTPFHFEIYSIDSATRDGASN